MSVTLHIYTVLQHSFGGLPIEVIVRDLDTDVASSIIAHQICNHSRHLLRIDLIDSDNDRLLQRFVRNDTPVPDSPLPLDSTVALTLFHHTQYKWETA